MATYKKYKIHRVKHLNDTYFELLFQKDTLNFVPGCAVTLYNEPDVPLFLASGMQEAWCRLILNTNDYYFKVETMKMLKLDLEVSNKIPTLMQETNPNFIITSEMVSPFFNYVSTYPKVKCKICYLGNDLIAEPWIKTNQQLVKINALSHDNNIYVMGNGDILSSKAKSYINNCKFSYLT